jgi:hypothetical protein
MCVEAARTKSELIAVATVYTCAMPKFVYVQVRGAEKPVMIQADKVERQEKPSPPGTYTLIVSHGGTQVGEFNGADIAGWWFQDVDV